MPQLEQIDTYFSQLLWLAITFTALYFFLRKVVLPGIGAILEERQDRIRMDLEIAASLKQEAEAVRAAYEETMAEGRAEAQRVLRAAADRAAQDAARQHAKLGEEIAAEIAAAETRIGEARDQALDNVRAVAADLSRDVAERLLGATVDESATEKAVAAVLKERA